MACADVSRGRGGKLRKAVQAGEMNLADAKLLNEIRERSNSPRRNDRERAHLASQRDNIQRVCGSKKRYATERIAAEVARECMARRPETVLLRSYYCDYCNAYHLTSAPKFPTKKTVR